MLAGKRTIGTVGLVGAVFLVSALVPAAWAGKDSTPRHFITINGHRATSDDLLVKFQPGQAPQSLAGLEAQTGVRARRMRKFRLIDWYHVELSSDRSLPQAVQAFAKSPGVERVEPNYVVRPLLVPDDPLYGSLWGMDQIGGPDAWDLLTPSDVLVAVIDTGVDYDHEDLAANMWVNPGETPGDGIDNDFNGFVDDVHGWDFYDNDPDPMDEEGHGTHVAGTIGAVGNNATGVAGACWGVEIMAVRFLGTGGGTTVDAIEAVEYATLNGAKILNNSWGGGGYSRALYEMIAVSDGFGALFVAAAGNGGADGIGDDNDAVPFYPASYANPNIISVAASTAGDALAGFSNFGAESVDLAAPGVSILSTYPGDSYTSMQGTSMAAPHVAGACALLWAWYPSLNPYEVRGLILNSAFQPNVEEPVDDPETLNPYAGKLVSEGRLHMFQGMSDLEIVTVSPLPPGESGVFYSHTIEARGGVPPLTWAVLEAPADAWYGIGADTGVLSGMPAVEEDTTFQFIVEVTDSDTTPVSSVATFTVDILNGYILFVESDPFTRVEIKGGNYGVTDYYAGPFSREVLESASLLAPQQWADRHFYRWQDDDGLFNYDRSTSVSMYKTRTMTSYYDPIQNFYVNDDTPESGIGPGDDANPGTAPGAPKRHIQAMLDTIEAGGYEGYKWRVIVSAGTYEENVVLNSSHSGLILQGLGWDTAIIDGGAAGPCIHAARWSDGTIMGFRLTNGDTADGGGGIRLSNGCEATIIRNTIDNNTAVEGGGIAAYSSTVTIKDNYIEDNTADEEGGAILLVEGHAVMIEGNAITGSSAPLGAGIRCWLSTGWITDNEILNNTATGGYGGGIYSTGSGFTIDYNLINTNTASRGAGIFCWASGGPMEYNTITENVAVVAGGGISCEHFSTQSITNNVISQNQAHYGGGVFFSKSEPPDFTGNTITYNTATDSGGGVFLSEDLSFTIGLAGAGTQNDISYNTATSDGGGIYIEEGCTVQIGTPSLLYWGNYIDENVAGRFGGAVFCGANSAPIIVNNTMGDGQAVRGGGVYCSLGDAEIGDGSLAGWNSISSNVATTYGGGIYIAPNALPTINTNSISSNQAEEGGGVFVDEGSSAIIAGGSLTSNEASTYGGGIRCLASSPQLLGVPVGYNEALVAGGGIYLTDESEVYMTLLYVYANAAPEGSGIYAIDSTLDLLTCVVSDHTCVAGGAGIRAQNSVVTIDDTVIKENRVPTGRGGGIYLYQESMLTMTASVLQGNEAVDGGGMYIGSATPVALPDGAFNNVVDNTATRGAGIYCAAASDVTIAGTRFGESHADQGSGIFCAAGATPRVRNCLFIGNSAPEGAGIYCSAGSSPTLRNITSVGNVSTLGAAGIHSEEPTVAVRGSIFWLNNEDLFGVSATYCCIPNPPAGAGNFGGDPLLAGPWYSSTLEESPSQEYVGSFSTLTGRTVFSAVGAGLAADELVGMWLNPSVRQNTQFLIVANTAPAEGLFDISVKGDATGIAQEGDRFLVWGYHPKSTGGRWTNPGWVVDPVKSPCVDAGDPADVYASEPEDNGDRINMGAYGNTEQASRTAEAQGYLLAETGTVAIDDSWTTVPLTEDFVNPVVVARPATSNEWSQGVVRLRNVSAASFQVRFQEWGYLDGPHAEERVRWLAVERGNWSLGGGQRIAVDSVSTNNTDASSPDSVAFLDAFAEAPVAFAQVMTYNGASAAAARVCGVATDQIALALQVEEAAASHVAEQIGFVAVSEGVEVIGTLPCNVARAPDGVSDGSYELVTDWLVWVSEEQSADAETGHPNERVGYITFGDAAEPPFLADMQTCNNTDTANLRCSKTELNVQHGVASAGNKWVTVAFAEAFDTAPVVVAGPATRKEKSPGVVRIRNVSKASFQIKFQEWEYLNGGHVAEKIHWLAVEPGVKPLQRGNILVAGTLRTKNTNVKKPTSVAFSQSFARKPAVIAQVQTVNDTTAVTDRICAVSKDRFTIAMQEEEKGGKHKKETIGYVAVTKGATSLGEVPCRAGLTKKKVTDALYQISTALGNCKVFIEEEKSKDSETTHAKEIVGYIALGGNPVLVADIQTCSERDTATVRYKKTLTSRLCQLSVSAEDQAGESLSGVAVASARQGPGRPTVAVTGAELAAQRYRRGAVVMLEAQQSLSDGTRPLQFSHWEVDGEPAPEGQLAVEVKMIGDRKATAVYAPTPY